MRTVILAQYCYYFQALKALALISLLSLSACVARNATPSRENLQAKTTRVVFASCIDPSDSPAWGTILNLQPELVILMGDNSYISQVPKLEGRSFEAEYEKLFSAAGFEELAKAIPIVAIWDDHDYGSPDGDSSFNLRKESTRAFRAFWSRVLGEHQLTLSEAFPNRAITRKLELPGIRFLLSDNRSFRLNHPKRGAQVFGAQQIGWFKEQLLAAGEHTVVFVSGNQILNPQTKYESLAQHPEEREQLLELFSHHEGPLLVTSGDRHFSEVSELLGSERKLTEVTVSALSHRLAPRELIEDNPHRRLLVAEEPNFALVEFRYADGSAELSYYRDTGEELASCTLKLN